MKWSAGWGSACDPCAKAKTRCIRAPDADDPRCNRCQSLNVPCPKQVRKPRKKRARHPATARPDVATSQTAPEHDALHTTSEFPEGRGVAFVKESTNSTTNDGSHEYTTAADNNVYVKQIKVEPVGAFNASTTLPGFHPFPTPTCTCISDTDADDHSVTPESDEALLAIYRTRLSPQFPFVIIPDDLTAIELQKSRPFLAKAVRMVASLRDRRSMWRQSKVLLRQISEAVFMGPDRTLDLLQSIVVFLGFFHYFCYVHGQFNTLSHLASGIIEDMRLDIPRRKPMKHNGIQGIDPAEPRAISNDEKRAFLAIWYINSSFAVTFKKVNSPARHFTQHMERQLHDLRRNFGCETDEVLAQLIYGQRISEMVAQFQQSDQSVDVRLSSTAWTTKLDSLLLEFGKLRGSESHQQTHHYLVSSHHNSALLHLLEPRLLDPDNTQSSKAIATLQNTPQYFHMPSLDANGAANTALRAWFEDWLTIPVCHFFYMPMPGYLHLTNATVVLLRRARLALLTRLRQGGSTGLDANLHNYNAGMPMANSGGSSDDLMLDLLERLASRLEEARVEMAAAHCFEWANDFLDLVSWKLRERKACIEKWAKVIDKEILASNGNGLDMGGEFPRVGDMNGAEADMSGFLTMDDAGLYLDPLEALLLSGGDAYDSWL